MGFLKNEKGISEVVGAMMILMILVLYLGIMQTREVPKWNEELERQQFDTAYNDFVTLRGNLEDISAKNIPKTSSLHMGVKYPQRFMLQNSRPGASGTLSTYPLRINISYETTNGTRWKNYTSMGIKYQQNGISDSPTLIYENGLMMKDYDNGHVFSVDDNQPLTTKDNIFIPILNGPVKSGSSMEIESLNIQPISKDGFAQVKFASMNATIETKYPEVWKKLAKDLRPDGSNFTVESDTNCSYENSDCIKLTYIPGYNVKKLNLPNNDQNQFLQNQMYMGMISFDNSLLNSRGPTGVDGQDMWEKNQGRLDIPAGNLAKELVIRDITMGRVEDRHDDNGNHDHEEHDNNDNNIRLKFSITDNKGHLWTIEIKLVQDTSSLTVDSVYQKYPRGQTTPNLNVSNGKYNEFTNMNITNSREVNLTKYYQFLSNISSPNALTVDRMDTEILYVNFRIN